MAWQSSLLMLTSCDSLFRGGSCPSPLRGSAVLVELFSHLIAAQQLARQCARALLALEGDAPIHYGVAIAIRLLHPPPVVVGQVIKRLHRQHPQLLQIIDHDVRGHPLTQPATVADADSPA